jgi:hypothetical protein
MLTFLNTAIPYFAIVISIISAWFVYRADRRQTAAEERQKKAAVLEVKPLVQAKPVHFVFHKESNFGDILLEVTNPSAYDAFEVTFDVKYNGNDWIAEWSKANNQPQKVLPKLAPDDGWSMMFRGALPYPMDEICTKRKGFDVYVRAKWRNEKNRTFEMLAQHELICTTVGQNQSVTFLLKDQKTGG